MPKTHIDEEVKPQFAGKEQYKEGYGYCAQVDQLGKKEIKYIQRCNGHDKKGNPKGCKAKTIVTFPDGKTQEFNGFLTEAQVDSWFLRKCGCDCVKKDVAISAKMKR